MPAPLKLGFVGCGEVTIEKHLPALAEVGEIETVAVADIDPARLRVADERFRIRRGYRDLRALLEHPGLEAVAVCLPPVLQAEAAMTALEAGKHVWIEPPQAMSLAECDALIDRAARSPGRAMVGFHMRWHRLVRQARAIILSGRLGRLHTIRAIWNSPREDDETLPDWRRRRALGGGAMVEVGVAHFDLWRYLLQSEVAEVFALSVHDRGEDAATVLSGQMANGVLVSAVLSERANHDMEIEICGKAGRLRVACFRFDGLECYRTFEMPSAPALRLGRVLHFLRELPRALPRTYRAGNYRVSYQDQWRHFHRSIRAGVPVEATLDDGRRALAVMLAAAESATAHRPAAVRS